MGTERSHQVTGALRLRWVREAKTLYGNYDPRDSEPDDELLSVVAERRVNDEWSPVMEPVLTMMEACAPAAVHAAGLRLLGDGIAGLDAVNVPAALESAAWISAADNGVVDLVATLPEPELSAIWFQLLEVLPAAAERLAFRISPDRLAFLDRNRLMELLRDPRKPVRQAAIVAARRRMMAPT